MKYFSILFTVLFFLGFASITYAESVLITINKDSDSSSVFIEDNIPLNEIEEKLSWFSNTRKEIRKIYTIKPDECITVTDSQLNAVSIVSSPHITIEVWRSSQTAVHISHILPQDISNPSSNCIAIEQWMQIKEQEFFRNN